MTPKDRLITAIRHGQADCVPVAPDMSNMIPARLTGKPFWDIYLYQDPPLWLAYIHAVRHFGFDGFLDYQVRVTWPEDSRGHDPWQPAIVRRTDDRIYVQPYRETRNGTHWADTVTVYFRDNPPTARVPLDKVGLPRVPTQWEPVEGVKEWPQGEELFSLAYETLGEDGVLGITCGGTAIGERDVYRFHDHPGQIDATAQERVHLPAPVQARHRHL